MSEKKLTCSKCGKDVPTLFDYMCSECYFPIDLNQVEVKEPVFKKLAEYSDQQSDFYKALAEESRLLDMATTIAAGMWEKKIVGFFPTELETEAYESAERLTAIHKERVAKITNKEQKE